MIPINEDTKIAFLLKSNPDALEALISLSPKFDKLRNPLLRKLMAGRTSIAMASKMGGCTVNDFFEKLEPLGFKRNKIQNKKSTAAPAEVPDFVRSMPADKIIELDVRPIISSGKDPLTVILENVKAVQPGMVFKLVNSFEPSPLIALLQKKGFRSAVDTGADDVVTTYFSKEADMPVNFIAPTAEAGDWDEICSRFEGRLQSIDVREMEMPQPMLTILDALEQLSPGNALYVCHKRIPVFLLPELAERKFDYRIKEVSPNEVCLVIFKS